MNKGINKWIAESTQLDNWLDVIWAEIRTIVKALAENSSYKELSVWELGVFYVSYVFILSWGGILRSLNERIWEILEKLCVDYRSTRARNLDET